MFAFPPLFGAAIQLVLSIILFIVISLLSKLAEKRKNEEPKRPEKRNPPVQPNVPPRVQLDNEIDAFLRRAGLKKPSHNEVIIAQPVPETAPGSSRRTTKPLKQAGWRTDDRTAKQSPLPAETTPMDDEVGAHADQLGQNVRADVEAIDRHVHDVFDHQLGQFKSSSRDASKDRSAATRRAIDIRQAIIISEVLKRPEF